MDPNLLKPCQYDPIYGGPIPAWQPQQYAHTWRHDKKKQIVWPRDKKQRGAHTWDRWKDVFTGKGPDMWISRQNSFGPHRPIWTGWKSPHHNHEFWDNLGYQYRKDDEMQPLRAQRRRWEKYDFKSRRYRMPKAGVWSDVKWNHDASFPLYWRDQYAEEAVAPEFDGGAFNQGFGPNPFRYQHGTLVWDWNCDKNGWPADHRFQWERRRRNVASTARLRIE